MCVQDYAHACEDQRPVTCLYLSPPCLFLDLAHQWARLSGQRVLGVLYPHPSDRVTDQDTMPPFTSILDTRTQVVTHEQQEPKYQTMSQPPFKYQHSKV